MAFSRNVQPSESSQGFPMWPLFLYLEHMEKQAPQMYVFCAWDFVHSDPTPNDRNSRCISAIPFLKCFCELQLKGWHGKFLCSKWICWSGAFWTFGNARCHIGCLWSFFYIDLKAAYFVFSYAQMWEPVLRAHGAGCRGLISWFGQSSC